jgi:amidase
MSDACPTSVTGTMPEGLLDAFWGYESALAENDLAALDEFFSPGPATLRGDNAGLLVGHDQISRFRGGRGGAPVRDIRSLHVRVIDADHALVMAANAPRSGGSGLVTQLWTRANGSWLIDAAQVASPPAAVDSTIWRVVGTPLLPPSGHGALDGETIAVKDLFAVAPFAVGAGIPEYLASSPRETTTAAAVRALLDAGAAVRGIAQTDEFAYSIAGTNAHYGTPPNPAVPLGLPGGSSSGPAAAVALGHATIGLATDTAGSIRVPASYQGLWGIRTTHGSVSTDGLLPLAPSFDTVGWLTRTPERLAAAASATLDPATQRGLGGGVVVSPALLDAADPDVREAFTTELDRLENAGLIDHPVSVELGDIAELFSAFRTVQAAEAWISDGAWINDHPGVLGADVAARFAWASGITPETEVAARTVLAAARQRLDAVLGERVLLLPSASSTAPSRTTDAGAIERTRTATLSMTCVAGIGGYPAVSAPLLEVGGLPVGLCLVGPRHGDLALIELARTLSTSA